MKKRLVSYSFLILLSVLICHAPVAETAEAAQAISSQASNIKKNKYKRKPLSYFWNRHHFEAKLSGNKLVKYELIRNKDGKIRLAVYPHGYAEAGQVGKIKKYTVPAFKAFLKSRNKKGVKLDKKTPQPVRDFNSTVSTVAASTTYNTGLGLGYNSSTGYIPQSGYCFNATTSLSTPGAINDSFSSQNTASSFASETNVSASVNGSYGLFSASEKATYQNNYQSSQQSGQTYFTASAVYTASNTLDTSNGANTALQNYGNQQLSSNFSTSCGSQFVNSLPVGFLVTGQFAWSTSSSSNSTSITSSTSGSYGNGLDTISTAVSKSTFNSTTSNQFDFTVQVLGDTPAGSGTYTASQYITNAIADNASYQDGCFNGNVSDCNTFATNMNSAAASAVSTFNSYYGGTVLPSDLSNMVGFPNGVQGVSTSPIGLTLLSSLISVSDISDDILEPYATQITSYLTLLNQISTLNQRVGTLMQNIGSGTGPNTLNPYPQIDIYNDYLAPLALIYGNDYSSILANLKACLTATSDNVGTACATIVSTINTGVTDADQWYGSNGPNPNKNTTQNQTFAQQNATALQYNGSSSMSPFLAGLWVNTLPSPWTYPLPSSITNIAGNPAFIGVAIAPYYWPSYTAGVTYAAYATIFPQPSNGLFSGGATSSLSSYPDSYTLTNNGTNQALANNPANAWHGDTGKARSVSYVNGCSPPITFYNLCSFNADVPNVETWEFYSIPYFF